MTTGKLGLPIITNTVKATAGINKLENRLRKLSKAGVTRGGLAGFGANGPGTVKQSVSGIGGANLSHRASR